MACCAAQGASQVFAIVVSWIERMVEASYSEVIHVCRSLVRDTPAREIEQRNVAQHKNKKKTSILFEGMSEGYAKT